MARIALAGFQHETNTFAPSVAGWDQFVMADSWPGLLTGVAVVDDTRGMNLPIAGAVLAAEAAGLEVCPLLWCAAEPSGPVTDDAFDRVSAMILTGLADAGPVDAVYLDLHGAMVTDSHDDGEAVLVQRIRDLLGADVPIGVSLDLHANLSRALVDLVNVITIYRSYPHLDMTETGARCVRALVGPPRHAAFREVPFMVPLHAQSTETVPCRGLYDRVAGWSSEAAFVELAMGFTAADVYDCGPAVVAYAETPEAANALADKVLGDVIADEDKFSTALATPAAAVRRALAAPGPVVLADVQDNPGAGGSSDTTGVLRALAEAGARGVIAGVFADPTFAAHAHRLGAGQVLEGALGGASGVAGDAPLAGRYDILALSDGRIAYSGQMYGGGIAELGPSALVALSGTDIRFVVSSTRIQCLDQALFTHFGINPAQAHIIAVKSTVHFQADFAPIARQIINVASPGHFPCTLSELRFQNAWRRVAGHARDRG
jgi:microcystin degradation protein MlrC